MSICVVNVSMRHTASVAPHSQAVPRGVAGQMGSHAGQARACSGCSIATKASMAAAAEDVPTSVLRVPHHRVTPYVEPTQAACHKRPQVSRVVSKKGGGCPHACCSLPLHRQRRGRSGLREAGCHKCWHQRQDPPPPARLALTATLVWRNPVASTDVSE